MLEKAENERKLIWEKEFEKALADLRQSPGGFIDWTWGRLLYSGGVSAEDAAEKIYRSNPWSHDVPAPKQLAPEGNERRAIWDAKFEKALQKFDPTLVGHIAIAGYVELYYARGLDPKDAAKMAAWQQHLKEALYALIQSLQTQLIGMRRGNFMMGVLAPGTRQKRRPAPQAS